MVASVVLAARVAPEKPARSDFVDELRLALRTDGAPDAAAAASRHVVPTQHSRRRGKVRVP